MNSIEKNRYRPAAASDPDQLAHSAPERSATVLQRLKSFNTFWDDRFEDLTRETWLKTTYRDLSAGLVVALTAIPMAMGFAMAMGLRPEQGIIAGALACIIGRTWGGSKYQVYGPTAAFIPIIAGLMQKYGEANGGSFVEAHGFLVLVSAIAGVILMLMGLFGLGRYAKLVPNSIIVGFTVGIATAIALTNLESILGIESFNELLGEDEDIKGGMLHNLTQAFSNLDKINLWSVMLGLMTFILTKGLLRISIFIPAPLIAIGISTALAATVLADKGVILVRDIYGSIPNNFFVFTPPAIPDITAGVVADIAYFVAAIVFVSAVESLLCSSMADRLAGNRKTPFNPDKEFWGQGLVQIITPMVNGFPCTGALARTATSIKAGAVTPLAGYFKGLFKLTLAYYIAGYLELVPMACIGGILLWVASNMIKVSEIKEVFGHNRFHAVLMVFTAVMVPATDFLTGVLAALVIYFAARRFCDTPAAAHKAAEPIEPAAKLATPATAALNFDNVSVALALRGEDAGLLRYVERLAELGIGKTFYFVHVANPKDAAGDLLERMREAVQQRLAAKLPKARVHYRLLHGPNRIDALVGHSLEAKSDVTLLGHRPDRSGQRSLARRLAMLGQGSVWMVPNGSNPEFRRILVPIDFSASSAAGLSQAAAIARAAGVGECSAIHVFVDDSVIRYEEHDAIKRGEEEAEFARFVVSADTRGICVNPIYEEGIDATRSILEWAKRLDASLIAISTRGHSRAAAVLLGSTTTEIMANSAIPVLVVKHDNDHAPIRDVLLANRYWQRHDPRTN
ncbi:SulP family inorganic anion transporter [Methylomonas koyamae]|uniref:SulP family inorganic anion transporter n=1 Tax=Methylomonas koyamae TaxID=702114 RepID=UPI002872FAB7|nr:SulP family inorganic anion transporter [Methylomonas koyamae]WNB74287.1 SulP family inorganic anion transporter [Methylomonas koyamae]